MLLARAAARFPAAARLPSKQAVRFASTDNKLTVAFAEPPFMAAAKQNWSRTSYAQNSNAMTGAGLIGALSLTITICLAPAILAVVDSIRNPKHGHDDH